ncbi:hypothetical protein N7508_007152 [Penicillium antarcticum]|uniref:uncharacterized protein n=1 Tax=Penicillium antarcticum TaxID=416450 RepID=UPI0023A05F14|nr:uncharacterized protein N7508_007152 [Penicillium antarcticum]KAJ5302289.1 hypothetical protein N7508_007152 [Penicillium antarcticum]
MRVLLRDFSVCDGIADFAELGPNGLPSLLLIDYDELSHGDHYESSQVLLGRDIAPPDDEALPFQVFSQAEHDFLSSSDDIDGYEPDL